MEWLNLYIFYGNIWTIHLQFIFLMIKLLLLYNICNVNWCICGIDYSYFLKKCDLYSYDSNLDLIDKIYVINLDRRFEKWERVTKCFLIMDCNIPF